MAPSLETIVRYFYSLFILSLSLSAFSKTDGVKCNILISAKCMCDASMTVKCGDKQGNIKDDTKVIKLKILVTNSDGMTREVILENPPGGAKDYFSLNNEWLREKVDLKKGETMAIAENGLIIDSATILYEDEYAKKELGTISEAPSSSEYCSTSENEQPMLLTYLKGCGNNKLCAMRVKCELPKEIQKKYGYPAFVDEEAVCPVNENGSCPSPTECALDQRVVFLKESEKPISGSGNSSSDKSGSSKQ
jgi:hypothetical protein